MRVYKLVMEVSEVGRGAALSAECKWWSIPALLTSNGADCPASIPPSRC